MSALRDDAVYKLVHDYMGVDLEAVWETATRDLPDLKEQLRGLS